MTKENEVEYRRIKRLDQTTINRIAAGEIIHRPSNAIKELIENSIDAKATMIQVQVNQGGLKQFQIKDNGTGILKDDLDIVCERFTTSKLNTFSDLQSIGTFGFRGEALASITYVAHLQITTRTSNSNCAFKSKYSHGKPLSEPTPCAGNIGTTITVEDLFYNLKTRLKSFKNPNEEYSKILTIIQKYSIHFPKISFSCKRHNAQSDLNTAQTNTAKDTIGLIYGDKTKDALLELDYDSKELGYKLTGLVSDQNYKEKNEFTLFINIDSPILKRQLCALYSKHSTHQFLYICLEIPGRNIDVNIHPTKNRVCFLNEDKISGSIVDYIETKLKNVDDSRIFYVQTKVLDYVGLAEGDLAHRKTTQKTPAHKLVRTDSRTRTLDHFIENTPEGRSLKRSKSVGSQALYSSPLQKISENLSETTEIYAPLNFGNTAKSTNSADTKFQDRVGTIKNRQVLEAVSSPLKSRSESDLSRVCVEEKSNDLHQHPQSPNYTVSPLNEKTPPEYEFEISTQDDKLSQNQRGNDQDFSESTQQFEYERLFDSEIQLESISQEEPGEWIEVQLDSILSLRSRLRENEHPGLTEILQEHTFVGKYNERLALIQHKTSLLLVDYKEISKQMWYQFLLHGFSNFGVYFFDRISIKETITLYLETTSEKKEAEKKGEYGKGILVENRMMLKEYFSIIIDKDGHLVGIPMMIQEYSPNMINIPKFLYDLITKVEWLTELECFESLSRVIADFYSVEEFGDDEVLGGIIFPLFRKVLAKDGWIEEGVIKQVANLEDLYKIFERC